MDLDENIARGPGDVITELGRQDLDPLSVEELQMRVAALEVEIARVRMRMTQAVHHRATANDLFKQ